MKVYSGACADDAAKYLHAANFFEVQFLSGAVAVMASKLLKKRKGPSGKVKDILSDADFQRELVAAGDRLVVVNFSAVWYAVMVLSN